MFFQSKKKGLWKRLWRSRVNLTQQQQLQQQQHHLQTDHHQTYLNGQRNLEGEGDCGEIGSDSSTNNSSTFGNCCVRTNNHHPHRSSNTTATTASSNGGNGIYDYDQQLFRNLVDKLKERQLETLCQAVENCVIGCGGGGVVGGNSIGGDTINIQTDCVLVPRQTINGIEPQVISCRLWKWPDLRSADELKRITSCPNEKDPIYACCNPTHWSRICRTETPPPPYCLFAMDRLKPEDRAPSEDHRVGGEYRQYPGSLTTDGEEPSSSTGWCQLAYWELTQRVGRLFPVENSAVNVFSEQSRCDGLCLTTLAQQRLTVTPEPVLKARQKIGLGVTLSRESDGIWLYNRSTSPVFVHSPTLHDIDTRSMLVFRVPPGHCLRAFDPNKAAKESFAWPSLIAGAQTGPVDIHSVRISFAKGWGPKYSRQEVTACPCWLEVLLSPCR